MDVTKPYEFIRFGAMDVTKPCGFVGFDGLPLGLARLPREIDAVTPALVWGKGK